jgi:hypothetical protein
VRKRRAEALRYTWSPAAIRESLRAFVDNGCQRGLTHSVTACMPMHMVATG